MRSSVDGGAGGLRRGLGVELLSRALDHAGDFFKPPRLAVGFDIGQRLDMRAQEIDGRAVTYARAQQRHGESGQLVMVFEVGEVLAPIGGAVALAVAILGLRLFFQPVAEVADEQRDRVVDQRLRFVFMDVGQVLARDFAGRGAVPVIGLMRVGVNPMNNHLLAVA